MSSALQCEGLVKRFARRTALDGLTMDIPRGTVTGLVGSNGAGKTTLLSITAGILHADRGAVTVFGEGPFDPQRHRGRMTVLPQDAEPPRHARVRELLTFYARLQGLSPDRAQRESTQCLEWVHLSDRAGAPLRALSHGMKRRVMIAQAFLGSPELVLLDEPLSGLDPREVSNLRRLLASRRSEATLLISSHNLHEIELICDRVVFIEHGRTVRQDAMEAVVGRDTEVSYLLAGGDIPLDQLKHALPAARFDWEAAHRTLRCRFAGDAGGVGEVNRTVIECLFASSCEVLEVRRGGRLEQAYLSESGSRAPPSLPE